MRTNAFQGILFKEYGKIFLNAYDAFKHLKVTERHQKVAFSHSRKGDVKAIFTCTYRWRKGKRNNVPFPLSLNMLKYQFSCRARNAVIASHWSNGEHTSTKTSQRTMAACQNTLNCWSHFKWVRNTSVIYHPCGAMKNDLSYQKTIKALSVGVCVSK